MKIASLEVIPLSVRMKRPFRFAGVTRLESRNVIVRIRTDDDLVGYGEACAAPHLSSVTQAGVVEVIETLAAPRLIGADPTAFRPLGTQLAATIRANPFALAAVETALLDVAGKTLGVPLSTLLGGAFRDRIPVHASVGWDEESRVMVEEAVSAAADYEYIKVYLGRGELTEDLGRLRTVREAVGSDVHLMLDINTQWTATETLASLNELIDLGVVSIEQPLPTHDLAGQQRVVSNSPIDIIVDEGVSFPFDVPHVAHHKTGTAVNVGLSKMGGPVSAFSGAASAYSTALGVVVGSLAEMGIANAAGLQLAAALPELAYPSYLTGYQRYTTQITEPLPLSKGVMSLPEGPGIGVEVDTEALASLDARSA